ncbi:MAG: DNA polymerase III subunit delta [Candidatus Saccharimonadales bacterium]|nr:DNA polymerase III subunit delta [Candidatus Saccharimonadales bacterium]
MIYLFWGDNHYAKEAAIQDLVDSHISKHGSSGVERLDGEDFDAEKLQNLTAQSLFAEHRLLIIKDISMNKKVVQLITEVIERIPETTSVVFSEQKVKKNTKLYKQISKLGRAHEFVSLNASELVGWVREVATILDAKIEVQDARFLIERVGTNQMMLKNELTKLASYSIRINRQSIELLVDRKPEENIFDLLDNVAKGDTRRARDLYRDIRRNQAEPYYVMSMIGWQLSNMAVVTANQGKTAQQIAVEAGMSPFVAQKTMRLTAGMSIKTIAKMVKLTAKTDLDLKTTTAQPDQMVEQLIDKLGVLAKS